jgi:hypothetical protein
MLLIMGSATPEVPRAASTELAGLPVHGRQVLTGDDLLAVGALRVADLVRLADGWDAVSVDGYAWWTGTGPGATDTWAPDGWQLLLDGIPVALDVLGTTNLSHLALSPAEIDSVVLERGPAVWPGGLAPGGIVHVHTRRPGAGLGAAGRFATGSETGDPGPYRFTGEGGRNVDRVGHETFARASWGGTHGEVAAWARYADQALIPSDPAIADRYREILPGGELAHDHRALDLGIAAGDPGPGPRRQIRILGDATDGFHYLDILGQEVPVSIDRVVGAAAVDWPGERTRIESWLTASHTRVDTRTNSRGLRLDLRRTRVEAGLGASAQDHLTRFALAGGVEGGSGNTRDLRTRTWVDATFSSPLAGKQALSARAPSRDLAGGGLRFDALLGVASDGPLSGAIRLQGRWRVSPSTESEAPASLRMVLAGGRGVGPRLDHLASLRADGFDGPEASGTEPRSDGTARPVSWGHLGATLVHSLAPAARLTAGLILEGRQGLELLDPGLRSDPSLAGFVPDPVRRLDRGELVAEAMVGLRVRPVAVVTVDVVVEERIPLAHDAAVKALRLDPWPRHRGRARLGFRPTADLALDLHLRARARTRWPAYDAVATHHERVDATLPATATLDVVIRKSLVHGRMALGLVLENVTDAPDRTHPAGVDRGRGAYVSVTAGSDRWAR